VNKAPRSPIAGGALLAAAILLGVVVGTLTRESSLGFLAGLAIGLALIGAVWLIDRRRRR
jgi:hypothetical protein